MTLLPAAPASPRALRPRHLMLFNLYSQGHHAEHLLYLCDHWVARGYPGTLHLVVSPALLDGAPELGRFTEAHAGAGIRVTADPEALEIERPSRLGRLHNAVLHHRLLRRHVQAHHPDQVFLPYWDHAQLALAFDLRFDYPVQFSGIYFLPTLHYAELTGERPGWKERLKAQRKRQLLALSLRNPHLRVLFSLDVFAPPAIQPLARHVEAVALPEPFTPDAAPRPVEEVRAALGVAPGRKVLLLFGALTERKGILQLLEAVLQLAPAESGQLCLLLAGRPAEVDRDRLDHLLARIRAEQPLQLLTRMERIPADQVQDFFRAADLVLAPYQRHVGSSGILVRAAHAGAPVLGSDYGMLGALIRRYRMGLAVDSTRPDALAHGLRAFLSTPPEAFADAAAIRRYADANTTDAFATTIFHHLDTRWPGAVSAAEAPGPRP